MHRSVISPKKILKKIHALSFLLRTFTDNILEAAGCPIVEKVCFKKCASNPGTAVDGN